MTRLGVDDRMPFLEHLGVRLLEFATGRGRLEVVVRPEHLRDVGILHGGMSATLLDSVMGMSAASVAPPGHYVVTVQLNMNFIRPAWEGETLVATSEVGHSGRVTAVARGEGHTAEGVLGGRGSAPLILLLPTGPQTDRVAPRGEGGPPA